jgi:hypothetical protein
MIKYALSAAVAALALGAPMAEAQTTQPMPLTNPANPVMSNTSAATTVTAQPQAGADNAFGLGQPVLQQPDMVPMGAVPVPPGAVWIPGHYDWSPAAQNYVWIDGQFTLPPHPAAQWLAGHWQETPSSWIWIDGRWN